MRNWAVPKFSIETLKEDLLIEKGGSRVRDGLRKLSIRGDYNGDYRVEVWSKHDGAEIKWCGHIETGDKKPKKGEMWVWDYSKLSRSDMLKIGRWLIHHAKCKDEKP